MEVRVFYDDMGSIGFITVSYTHLIPDGIVFINGIPVVVLEFKSAVKENTTMKALYLNSSGISRR